MTVTCRVCGLASGASSVSVCCVSCGRLAAAYVLRAAGQDVRKFWDIGEPFVARRTHFLAVSKTRGGREEASAIGAGLAVGYLTMGLREDSLLSAALSLCSSDPAAACCCSALDVLFDERLMRRELLPELSVALGRQ